MIHRFLTFAIVMGLCVPVCLARSDKAIAQTTAKKPSDTVKLVELQNKRDDLFNQFNSLGGQRALETTQERMTLRKWQIDRIEGILARLAGSTAALEQMKKQVDEKSVVGLDDLAPGKKDAAEHLAEKALERAGSTGASRLMGWIGLIGDLAEIGGKKIIKEMNVDQMEELVRQNRINLHDALALESALLLDNNKDRKALEDLRDLKARYQEAALNYMAEKRRLANVAPRAPQCSKAAQSGSESILENALRDLGRAKQKIFKAIQSAPRYGGQFSFLLQSDNFYDVHRRKLELTVRLLKENQDFDCGSADAIHAGMYRIEVLTKRLELFIKYDKDNKHILRSMIADARKINSGTYF